MRNKHKSRLVTTSEIKEKFGRRLVNGEERPYTTAGIIKMLRRIQNNNPHLRIIVQNHKWCRIMCDQDALGEAVREQAGVWHMSVLDRIAVLEEQLDSLASVVHALTHKSKVNRE